MSPQPPPMQVPLLTEVIEPIAPLQQSEPVQPPLAADALPSADLPYNLVRPQSRPATEADAPSLLAQTSPASGLEAARASLSGALKSAREGRPQPQAAQAEGGPELGVALSEAQLTHKVLGVVQKQVDGLLDYRLREAMAPILQRHTDALVKDLREELKRTLQDVVTRAVAQEMAKVRPR